MPGANRDPAWAAFAAFVVCQPTGVALLLVPGTNVTVTTSHVDEINYASERRKLVAELIERALSTEARYPTRVYPTVPPGPYSNVELLGDLARKSSPAAPIPAQPEAVDDVGTRGDDPEDVMTLERAGAETTDDDEKTP